MTFDDFLDYLYDNSGSEYNMLSIINTINSLDKHRFKYIRNSVEYLDTSFILISHRNDNSDGYALLYYKYIIYKGDDIDNFKDNIIRPMFLVYCDTDEMIGFNKE